MENGHMRSGKLVNAPSPWLRVTRTSGLTRKSGMGLNTIALGGVFLVGAWVNPCVYAQAGPDGNLSKCSEAVTKRVGRHFGLSDFSYPKEHFSASSENGGLIVAGVCKPWLGKARVIAAFAYDAGVASEKALLVALIDARKTSIIASYRAVIQEDAAMTLGSSSFRIDTARYELAPDVRAFGLDMNTSYSQGCVDGGLGPIRTLFVQDGKALRRVLADFYVSSWSFLQGGPSCVSNDGREVVIEDVSYSIGIGDTKSKGYANLRITATSSERTRKPLSYELQYNGREYSMIGFNGGGEKIERWRR